jgi:hypothetical protein
MGSRNPGRLCGISGLTGFGRSHTAMDIKTMAIGHATALEIRPNEVAPSEYCRTLDASPTTFSAIPVARRIHGARRVPERTAKPPTIRPKSSASPIGRARLTTVPMAVALDCRTP